MDAVPLVSRFNPPPNRCCLLVVPAIVVALVIGGGGVFVWSCVLAPFPFQGGIVLQILFAAFLLFFGSLCLWSLFKASMTDPGSPPQGEEWVHRATYSNRPRQDPDDNGVGPYGAIRYCKHW
jgi:hypothetical protein